MSARHFIHNDFWCFSLGTYLCWFLTVNLTNSNPPEKFHKLTEDNIFIIREKTTYNKVYSRFEIQAGHSHQSKTLASDQKWTLICFHISFQTYQSSQQKLSFEYTIKSGQDRHGRFLAGKDTIVAATSPVRRLCRLHFLFLKIQPRTKPWLPCLPLRPWCWLQWYFVIKIVLVIEKNIWN